MNNNSRENKLLDNQMVCFLQKYLKRTDLTSSVRAAILCLVTALMRKDADDALTTVFSTTNYDKFKRLDENRDVTKDRIKKLTASFGEKEIINPIIVNENYEIIDGQGRYEALKLLKKPIKYIIARGADINDCRRMNRYNTSWSAIDWIVSYADNSNQSIASNYKNFINCMKKHNIGASRIASTSHVTIRSGGGENYLLSGNLTFTENNIAEVDDCIKKGQEVLDALTFAKRPNEAFWRAVRIMIDTNGYDHDRMIRNCTSQRAKYAQMANLEDQLKEFSRIYNFRKGANPLYFEDYMRNKGYATRNYDTVVVPRKTISVNVSTLKNSLEA